MIALDFNFGLALFTFAAPSVSRLLRLILSLRLCLIRLVKIRQTLINFGLLNYLNTAADGWNITVTITKPDNTTEILGGGPLKTWSTGNAGHYYIPDTVGTYYLQTSFDESIP